MTGYDKDGHTIESTTFRPWAPGWKVEDDHPVGYISWNDAVAFCAWLSQKEGRRYRLPTEAEWEYACRAGTSSRYSCGNDPEQLIDFANASDADRAALFPGKLIDVFDKSGKKTGERIPYPFLRGHDGYAWTAPVGSFRPNPFGLHDMHGNSWEWFRLVRRELLSPFASESSGPATGEIRLAAAPSTTHRSRCAARAAMAVRRSRTTITTDLGWCGRWFGALQTLIEFHSRSCLGRPRRPDSRSGTWGLERPIGRRR